MSRRIVLLRHGKSDWGASYGSDHDWPLAKRGRKAVPHVGRFLSATGWTPDRVVTSTAIRARDTARLVTACGSWQCELVEEPALYGASLDTLVELIRGQRSAVETLLLVGSRTYMVLGGQRTDWRWRSPHAHRRRCRYRVCLRSVARRHPGPGGAPLSRHATLAGRALVSPG